MVRPPPPGGPPSRILHPRLRQTAPETQTKTTSDWTRLAGAEAEAGRFAEKTFHTPRIGGFGVKFCQRICADVSFQTDALTKIDVKFRPLRHQSGRNLTSISANAFIPKYTSAQMR